MVPACMNMTTMMLIHGAQTAYLMRFLFPFLKGAFLALAQSSWVAPAGQIHPQNALPKNRLIANRTTKTMRLPEQ